MLELDDKLLSFLRALRTKGGVVNIHVMRATALALIQSNPSQMQYYNNFGVGFSLFIAVWGIQNV